MSSLREQLDLVIAKNYYAQEVPDYWRVSSISMPWDAYHKRLGSTPDEIDDYDLAREEMKMKLGELIHLMLHDLTKQAPDVEVLGSEEEVWDRERNLCGHYDEKVKIGDKKIRYDYKTVNEKAYSYMKWEGDENSLTPYPHHVTQLCVYEHLDPDKTDELRLFYIDRNNGRREEIPVEYNQAMVDEGLAEIDMLNKCWESKTPPPPPELDD